MQARPLTLSQSYLATVRSTVELHKLIASGKGDDPEADEIRDASASTWGALSKTERERARLVSEDLYSLHEVPSPPQQMTREAQRGLNEAYEAKERSEWDKALALLREWQAYVDPALVTYLRGSIWFEAGDAMLAGIFFERAHELDAANLTYASMYLHCLSVADPKTALQKAAQILEDYKKHSPVIYVRAADIKFASAKLLSDAEGNRIFFSLEPILKEAILIAQTEPKKIDSTTVVMAFGLLGFGYEFLGRWQDAVNFFSMGIHIDPNNDGLLVARGMILYGSHEQAIGDLEQAIALGSPLIWPYAILAHHALKTHRYKECIQLCDKALEKKGSRAVKSEIREWDAIAQAALEYSPGNVEQAFEQATRLDAANERAMRNLKKLKNAPRRPSVSYFEVRSEVEVRTSAITERRYAMAET